ncbi:Metallo-dependent phosphatase [Aulographum hederae CBS 113979]|uniref:Metallo-dependent phosphatase n=1 Tax=Aulographum hederae CBS 113979 TaxID=1176131 RepID=A0A6G1HBG3_9PEZI|nr:Metallo-dependent phosphatase [Aulographum hederae CBS 113979]
MASITPQYTMKTRFVILSDTHDKYEDLQNLPKADVLLHCGDLTQVGGLSNYKSAISMMKNADAELKLVIPGNHDLSLDATWWSNNLIDDDDPEESTKALELFRSQECRDAGIYYLEEGTHTFTLKSSATFKIFASPYTPEFCDMAFPYPRDENHWPGKIPDDTDIIMTHGPARFDYTMDVNFAGDPCGCPFLATAVTRVKPLLHCFGHIHEGHGVQKAIWGDGGSKPERIDEVHKMDKVVDVSGKSGLESLLNPEKETLLVNAAIEGHRGEPRRKPWVVDLNLRKG